LAQAKFDSLGIRRLSHPPYSPDTASCNFSFFGYIKMQLEGISFATPSTLICDVQEMLDEICLIEWVTPFDEWEIRLRRCIDSGGEYL
jgi:hypothetical protein